MLKKYNEFIVENLKYSVFDGYFSEFEGQYKVMIASKFKDLQDPYKVYLNFMSQGPEKFLSKEELRSFNAALQKLQEYRAQFNEMIESLLLFYSTSFSGLASSDQDPDKDYELMQGLLDRAGFTIHVLKKLFDPKLCAFLNQNFLQFIQSNGLDERNGYLDLYLFKLDEILGLETTVWLGGDGWGSYLADEDAVIKYAYGYHKTPYGKLFLQQHNITEQQFIDIAYLYLKDYLKENSFDQVENDLKKMARLGYATSLDDINLDFDKYITLDDDRFIISYVEMCDDFNKMTDNKFENTTDPDWFKESILKSMYILKNLEVQDTDVELIFYN
jgi:hypothetical protein